jgi:PIN domain nuclease of toxin-antitoxin system
MKYLLDTATFLWLVAGSPELSPAARDAIADPENEVFLSAVSAWEIAIKHALGRLPLPRPAEKFVPSERERAGVSSLPLDEESTLHVHRLPAIHRDPFDRMLVCQAIVHGLLLLTPDPQIARYPVRTAW